MDPKSPESKALIAKRVELEGQCKESGCYLTRHRYSAEWGPATMIWRSSGQPDDVSHYALDRATNEYVAVLKTEKDKLYEQSQAVLRAMETDDYTKFLSEFGDRLPPKGSDPIA